jgi:hypothetical protein
MTSLTSRRPLAQYRRTVPASPFCSQPKAVMTAARRPLVAGPAIDRRAAHRPRPALGMDRGVDFELAH